MASGADNLLHRRSSNCRLWQAGMNEWSDPQPFCVRKVQSGVRVTSSEDHMSEIDYYGTKRVTAWEETKVKVSPDDTSYEVPGYGVRYADGYTSWSPKEAFEAAYKPITAMGFEGALAAMRAGHKVRRSAWTDVGKHLSIDDGKVRSHELDGEIDQPPVSVEILADDWMIVP